MEKAEEIAAILQELVGSKGALSLQMALRETVGGWSETFRMALRETVGGCQRLSEWHYARQLAYGQKTHIELMGKLRKTRNSSCED
ncbi:hypothetical protein X798_01564 [Onchocerca flexuosa]|uniref:Uncharacterized protein n=1 Tax=Onchocerca flexuosa TaxID=387005 RepID=A0A238C2K9_9BILA|nr:hypothetical protein X798_01564 [Onchocerca flexuosa]